MPFFCPKCGTEIAPGQTFCSEHQPHVLDLKPFDVRVCTCGRYFSGNRWVTIQDLEASVTKTIKEHLKQRADITIDDLPVPEKRNHKATGKATITYAGETYPITFPIKLQRCDKCSRLGTQYFTAKLQLRQPPAAVLDYIQNYLAPLAEKGVAVNKVEDTPRGPDLYLTHKAVARQLGEKLIRKYGGTMKSSEQLFSRDKQTGKNLYRLNVLVEFAAFTIGDAVLVEGRPVLITGLGKHCTGRDLGFDKKVVFTAGKEEQLLPAHKTTVATTKPAITVIHPVTYEATTVSNHEAQLPTLTDGQRVSVVIANKRIYITSPMH